MRDLTVRPMGIHDLGAVNCLGSLISPLRPWNIDEAAGILAEGLEISRVAVKGKTIRGFIIGRLHFHTEIVPTAVIEWISIDESVPLPGVAEKLIVSFITAARSGGAARILLSMPRADLSFREIFEKIGFTITGDFITLERTFSETE